MCCFLLLRFPVRSYGGFALFGSVALDGSLQVSFTGSSRSFDVQNNKSFLHRRIFEQLCRVKVRALDSQAVMDFLDFLFNARAL
jgi:hypothetical protein